ncbi:MAG: hypothetical protein U5K76_08670 [Woeseiaceae bacterium]|nr:hypothetical protein [Woeseiaceae bacterium]
MLGQWLEVSVQCDDVLESLAFYKALGFRELQTGDAWAHRYAVISDGDLSIGLHDRTFDSPALTFVQPDLGRHARSMADHGFDFSFLKLDEDHFNELGFVDTEGNNIVMIEARTCSPPPDDIGDSLCGTFFELTLPARDTLHAARFWAPLAPHVERLREEPTTHMRFDAGGMALGLSESIALDRPSLCFKCHDPERLAATVERHGFRWQKYPGFEGAHGVLQAPEGTRLYVFDEDFLGETYEVTEEEGPPPATA